MPSIPAYWVDLGLVDYRPAFEFQERCLEARCQGRLGPLIIVQQNYPVFTLGRSASEDNILASPEVLAQRGIEILRVNRGGDVTYHGPGQLIVSPLLYLGEIGLNANQYLHRLEDVLILLLREYNLVTTKREEYPGVWWGKKKIGAVGIAVRHGFTFHGLSLNVDLDLEPFSLINPCGIPQMQVTSMKEVLGHEVDLSAVRDRLLAVMADVFALQLEKISVEVLQTKLSQFEKGSNDETRDSSAPHC